MTWYEEEIKELKRSSITNLSIYVTSKSDNIATGELPEESAAVEDDVRRSLYIQENDSDEVNGLSSEVSGSDVGLDALQKELALGKQEIGDIREKRHSKRFSVRMEAQMDQRPMFYIETRGGRPDLTSIVGQVVKSAEQRDTVAVGGNSLSHPPSVTHCTNRINSLWSDRTHACRKKRRCRQHYNQWAKYHSSL